MTGGGFGPHVLRDRPALRERQRAFLSRRRACSRSKSASDLVRQAWPRAWAPGDRCALVTPCTSAWPASSRTSARSTRSISFSRSPRCSPARRTSLRRRFRIDALGLLVGPLGLAFLLGTFFLGKPLPAARLSPGFHHGPRHRNLLGSALFLLAGASAALYLVQERRLKEKRHVPRMRQPPAARHARPRGAPLPRRRASAAHAGHRHRHRTGRTGSRWAARTR